MKSLSRNYLEYDTYYKAKGGVNVALRHHACFSSIFHARVTTCHNIYTLYINRTYKYVENTYNNNICFLKPEEVCQFVDSAKEFMDFTYTLNVSKNKYTLTIDLNKPLIYHKFLLTYIRYLYEMPFSLYLYEVCKLKQEVNEFANESYLNLYNLVSATVPNNDHGCRIHNIGDTYRFKQLLTTAQIKNKLKKCNQLNELFLTFSIDHFITIKEPDPNTNELWQYKKLRKKRYKTYIHNYNILKKLSE